MIKQYDNKYKQVLNELEQTKSFSSKLLHEGAKFINAMTHRVSASHITKQHAVYNVFFNNESRSAMQILLPIDESLDCETVLSSANKYTFAMLQHRIEEIDDFISMQRPSEFLPAWRTFVNINYDACIKQHIQSLNVFNEFRHSLMLAMSDSFMVENDRCYFGMHADLEDVIVKYRMNNMTTKHINIDISYFNGVDDEEEYQQTVLSVSKLSTMMWLQQKLALFDTYDQARQFALLYELVQDNINTFKKKES